MAWRVMETSSELKVTVDREMGTEQLSKMAALVKGELVRRERIRSKMLVYMCYYDRDFLLLLQFWLSWSSYYLWLLCCWDNHQ